jgi:NADPH2:quinone reductase
MKAIRVHEYGNPDVLRYEEVATPAPGAGEVLVEIEAAGLNFVDVYHRAGQYAAETPFTPGMEAAGRVVRMGPGVEGLAPGDRVAYAMVRGSYAEYAVVPAARLVTVPDQIDIRDAAAVMLQGMTAHYLSHSTYPLSDADTALIHAAAGGVGTLLVQMAKMRGARVIGTASTPEKIELARRLGADEMIRYTEEDFVQAVDRLTRGAGVNVVYDSVGRSTFHGGLDCLRPRGMMVLFGQASGPVEPLDLQVLNSKGSLYVTRPSLSHYVAARDELLRRSADCFDWISAGKLEIRIDRTFPLAEAAEAHRYLEGRRTKGKVLLIP